MTVTFLLILYVLRGYGRHAPSGSLFTTPVGVSASATVDRRAPMAQCRAAHHGELLPVALEQSER